ncbi:MAG: IS21 family transposase [Mangrovibacterium sp.]
METRSKHPSKVFMWYKINELKLKGFNKSQISVELGLDRSTVRKYLSMDESEFLTWISSARHRPKKLREYVHFVKEALEKHPYLSSSQVEDWLHEHYPDLPTVHSKTVYNFVEQIRRQHDIPKVKEPRVRHYEKLPETAYGEEGQVDFGSFNMLTESGGRRKVYFFTMVLSRSRQKYIYFQSKPFTTQSTIEAHNRSFEYFQGQPRKLLYDQDRVLMVSENLGDLLLTQDFQAYLSSMPFTAVFCRKADPQSKGKVENVVGFVKKNFLPGRIYTDDQSLNESALGWLQRTGNGKKHAGIQKIPHQEWLIEQPYLLPYQAQELPTPSFQSYKVRKDNSISYKGNFYTLPLGTYQGVHSRVLLQSEDGVIHLFSSDNTLLATHLECSERGRTISNSDHRRDKSQSLEILKNEVDTLFKNIPLYKEFIGQLSAKKQRYLRDNLSLLKRHYSKIEVAFWEQSTRFCVENSLFNAQALTEVAYSYQAESEAQQRIVTPQIEIQGSLPTQAAYHPQYSTIDTYQKLMQ